MAFFVCAFVMVLDSLVGAALCAQKVYDWGFIFRTVNQPVTPPPALSPYDLSPLLIIFS